MSRRLWEVGTHAHVYRCLLVICAALLMAAPANGTVPGANGKIAFTSERDGHRDVWLMNADGSGQTAIQSDGAQDVEPPSPAWAPDGRDIAFTREYPLNPQTNVFVMEADGGNLRAASTGDVDFGPAWSPDGGRIAFTRQARLMVTSFPASGAPVPITFPAANETDLRADWSAAGNLIVFERHTAAGPGFDSRKLFTVDPAGGPVQPLTTGAFDISDNNASISPDGQTVVFSSNRAAAGRRDLYTVPIGGGTPTLLTDTPTFDELEPVWSPDGTKIAFRGRNQVAGVNSDIYTMNADTSGQAQLTTDPAHDSQPDWQRQPPPLGYPRPKGAAPVRVPLVPAYEACHEPNRTHGPPLAFPACNPPVKASHFLTTGTPDANGFPSGMSGALRLDAIVGNPATTADEADIGIRLSATDVRYGGDPALDFPYKLYVRLSLQLTDKDNGCCGFPATVRDDVLLNAEAQCTETPDPAVGSTCAVTTTADAFIPGMVREGQRGIWQMRQPVQVFDAGPDANGVDATLFLTQGLFVP